MSNSQCSKKTKCTEEQIVRSLAVHLVLNGKAEEAIGLLSEFYRVKTPRLTIGARGRYDISGCYDRGRKEICLKDSQIYMNPFIVLHEFYHHLRSVSGKHRGNEKYADRYALDSISFYMKGCHLKLNHSEEA
ncbi:MAG: hypothetical protein F7B59_01190 [Desulfurococcales archaeon]|nr:hypothetical protein [Desulfurococcales archaeon]